MMYTLGKVLVFMTAPVGPAVRAPVAHVDGLRGACHAAAAVTLIAGASRRCTNAHPRSHSSAPLAPALLAVCVAAEYARVLAASTQLVPALLRLTAPALDPSRCVWRLYTAVLLTVDNARLVEQVRAHTRCRPPAAISYPRPPPSVPCSPEKSEQEVVAVDLVITLLKQLLEVRSRHAEDQGGPIAEES